MATAAQLASLRTFMTGLDALTAQQLLSVWRTADVSDARSTTNLLLDTIPDVSTALGDVGAVWSADWYDEVRGSSSVAGRHTTVPARPAPLAQVSAVIRWAVTPLWSEDQRPGVVLENLYSGLMRLTRQPSRETILDATRSDPARPRYARRPVGRTCHFCLMLASRGAVYYEETVGFQPHGKCDCDPVPVWSPDDVPTENLRLADEWQEVTRGMSGNEARAAWARHIEDPT